MSECDGWNYTGEPPDGEDCRKLVTLVDSGMVWVGIRAWNNLRRGWMNGGEPERCHVKAWRDLPEPAMGFWQRGILHVRESEPLAARTQPVLKGEK